MQQSVLTINAFVLLASCAASHADAPVRIDFRTPAPQMLEWAREAANKKLLMLCHVRAEFALVADPNSKAAHHLIIGCTGTPYFPGVWQILACHQAAAGIASDDAASRSVSAETCPAILRRHQELLQRAVSDDSEFRLFMRHEEGRARDFASGSDPERATDRWLQSVVERAAAAAKQAADAEIEQRRVAVQRAAAEARDRDRTEAKRESEERNRASPEWWADQLKSRLSTVVYLEEKGLQLSSSGYKTLAEDGIRPQFDAAERALCDAVDESKRRLSSTQLESALRLARDRVAYENGDRQADAFLKLLRRYFSPAKSRCRK